MISALGLLYNQEGGAGGERRGVMPGDRMDPPGGREKGADGRRGAALSGVTASRTPGTRSPSPAAILPREGSPSPMSCPPKVMSGESFMRGLSLYMEWLRGPVSADTANQDSTVAIRSTSSPVRAGAIPAAQRGWPHWRGLASAAGSGGALGARRLILWAGCGP